MKHRILWAAVHAALAAQGVFAQTTNNDSSSSAKSGSVSGATAVSSPTVNVTPTVNNHTAAGSTSHSGSISGSTATGGQGGAGGVAHVTSTPTATSNAASNTSSRSDASNAGNTQIIQFNNGTPPVQTVNQNLSGRATQEQVLSGGTHSTLTTNGTQTQNLLQSVTGTTTENQNIDYHISGEQTQRIEYSGSYTVKNVPSVNGPPLTTSNDTCMGSTSGSINGPGFGIGLGSTWQDKNCVMLKNARELWNMGMKAASLALICMDDSNRTALEITGFVCPQTAARQRADAETHRVAAATAERDFLRRRVAELEAERRRGSRAWTRSAGEMGTPLPPPVVETHEGAPQAVVAELPAAAPAQASPVREPGRVLSSALPDAGSAAEVVRVVSEPAR